MARLGRAGRLCHDWLFLTQVDTQDRNEPLSFIPDQRKELRILCKKFSELLMLQCSDCSILIVWIFRRCFDREVFLRTKFGSCYLCGFHFQREKESSACIRFLQPADCDDKKLEVLWKTKQSLFCTQLQLAMIPDQNMHQRVGHWLSLGKTINRLRLHLRPFPCSIFFCNWEWKPFQKVWKKKINLRRLIMAPSGSRRTPLAQNFFIFPLRLKSRHNQGSTVLRWLLVLVVRNRQHFSDIRQKSYLPFDLGQSYGYSATLSSYSLCSHRGKGCTIPHHIFSQPSGNVRFQPLRKFCCPSGNVKLRPGALRLWSAHNGSAGAQLRNTPGDPHQPCGNPSHRCPRCRVLFN